MSTALEDSATLQICIKVTAAVSFVCSCCIACSIISNPHKRSVSKERIIVGLSCSDILFSFFCFLGTWPMPRVISGGGHDNGAVGNPLTCDVQGFFIQLGIMSPMYNGFLAIYCFLFVCRDWTRQRMKYVEILGHVFVFVFALSTAIAGLALELYNSNPIACWIAPFPLNCTQSYQITPDDRTTTSTDCIRGDNAYIYRIKIYYGIILVNIVLTFVSFLLIYIHIRKQENKMEAYTNEYNMANNTTTNNTHADSRRVAFRGALYTCAFFITWFPGTVAESLRLSTSQIRLEERVPFAVVVIFTALIPSQGFFNFLVYIQPTVSLYVKERKRTRIEKLQIKQQQAKDGQQKDDKQGHSVDERKRPLTLQPTPSVSREETMPSTVTGELTPSATIDDEPTASAVTGQLTLSTATIKPTPATISVEPACSTITGKTTSTMGTGASITASTIKVQPTPYIGAKEISQDIHHA